MQRLTHHHQVHQRFLKTLPYLSHSFCHNSPHCFLSTLHSRDSLRSYLGQSCENNPGINFTSHLSRAILRYQNLRWNVRQGRTNTVYYLYVESLTSQTHRPWSGGYQGPRGGRHGEKLVKGKNYSFKINKFWGSRAQHGDYS